MIKTNLKRIAIKFLNNLYVVVKSYSSILKLASFYLFVDN